MKELLEYLIKNIVDRQDDVVITEETDETGTVVFKVQVHPSDVGKVIGKKGKIINSVRNIVRIKAIKTDQRARVEVVNPPQEETAVSTQEDLEPASVPVPTEQPKAEVEKSAPAEAEKVKSEESPVEIPAADADPTEMPTKPEPVGKEKTVEELTQPQE